MRTPPIHQEFESEYRRSSLPVPGGGGGGSEGMLNRNGMRRVSPRRLAQGHEREAERSWLLYLRKQPRIGYLEIPCRLACRGGASEGGRID